MDEKTKLWLAAYDILVINPDAKTFCPECKTGTLKLKEEQIDENKIDRTVLCESCGQQEVFTIISTTIVDEQEEPE